MAEDLRERIADRLFGQMYGQGITSPLLLADAVLDALGMNDQHQALTIYAPIPVIDSDPNVLGEHLREVTFVGEGYGCYETFDVRPDAEDLGHEEAMKFITGDTDPYGDGDWPLDVERYEGRRFRYQGLTVECFWYWDGDGVLAFRITHPQLGVLRVIENDDCKKSYCWDDVDLPGNSEETTNG